VYSRLVDVTEPTAIDSAGADAGLTATIIVMLMVQDSLPLLLEQNNYHGSRLRTAVSHPGFCVDTIRPKQACLWVLVGAV
jgi:hypothetical protein